MLPSPHRVASVYTVDTRRVVCVGDVSGARDISALSKVVDDPTYPFSSVKSILTNAYAVGNLECVLSDRNPRSLDPKPSGIHLLGPTSFADTVHKAGFNAVSMANNHVCDFGPRGVQDTINALKAAGVGHFGAGAQASQPHVAKLDGITVAFLGFVAPHLYNGSGANLIDADAPRKVAHARDLADLVIVSVHWGEEYQRANTVQREQARMFVSAGANMIFGHHPHVTQSIEYVKNVPVFYSLGNFAFDSHIGGGRTRVGFAAEVLINQQGVVAAEILPYKIGKGYIPEFVGNPIPVRSE